MRLKARERGGPWRLTRSLAGWVVGLAVLGGCALVLVALGAYLRDIGWFSRAKQVVEEGLRGVPGRLENMFVTPPRITIDCKHKHVQKLAAKRDQALAAEYLLTSSDDFVPAVLRYTDEEGQFFGALDARIRLKGDVIDHLEGSKWSFRVHLRGDNALLGMKRFSLHHPQTRNYLGEWAYQRALAREDVLTLRYRFVAVTFNAKDLGIYAMEEHFEKRLIEHNRRREGPIVRFNEDMFWREKAQQEVPFPQAQTNSSGVYSSSEVDGFQTSQVLADPVARERFARASDRLSRFRTGELKTSEVFDVDLLARYYAVTDLFAAEHGARWHNVRFYYNPDTTLLEPIGFDGDAGRACLGLCGTLEGNYVGADVEPPLELYWARLFSDPVFFRAYMRELERVAQPAFVEELFQQLRPGLEAALGILRKEFTDCALDEEMLWRNQRYIASVLDPVRAMHGYARAAGGRVLELDLASIQGLPVEVHGVVHRGAAVAEFDPPLILPARRSGVPLTYRTVTVELPGDAADLESGAEVPAEFVAELKISHSVFGHSARRAEAVLPWARTVSEAAAEGVPPATDLGEVPFVQVDEDRKRIRLRRGTHTLERDLVIPAGYVLECQPGTQIDLVKSSALVSRSPVELVGRRELPVVIGSSDGTGQGLVVIGAAGRSTLSSVVFRGLSAVARPGWKLPGAVTFYESAVTVSDCRFEGTLAEDALNVVRTTFLIERSVFRDIASDAFDGDFCEGGRIVDCQFTAIANDAIDVSGTRLEIVDVAIAGAGDKGLSAGENSEMHVDRVSISDAEIGVASKDLSYIELHHPVLRRCKVGFTAFQKKPEFGPSRIVAHGIDEQFSERPFLIEEGSTMNHGSKSIPATNKKVEQMLYGAEYGKSSR